MRKWVRIVLSMMLSAGVIPCAESAAIYTGLDAHGIRWFGDTVPRSASSWRQLPQTAPDPAPAPEEPSVKAKNKTAPPAKAKKAVSRRRSKLIKTPRKNRAKARCEQYETALRKIRATMRSGYHEPQGSRLRQRRRVLQDRQFAECPVR